MAKTKGPLLSLEAHGSLSKILTYSKKRTGSQARKYNKPTGIPSAKQRGQRRLTEFLVAQWQNMSAGDKATWETNAKASGLNMAGYHYFLRSAQRDLYTHTGLCGYWHCNEIVGGKVLDLSGNANHGTLIPSYPANAPVLVDSYKTKFGKALSFDGIDDQCTVTSAPSLNSVGNTSVEILIKIPAAGMIDYDSPFAKHRYVAAGDQGGWNFMVHSINRIYFRVFYNANYESYTSISADKYYWATGTYNTAAQQVKLYLDGVLKHTVAGPGAMAAHDIRNLSFSNFGECLCVIDECCVYNRTLSAAEIATRHKFAMRNV